jgi:abortive infection bacteriophage resistance protein
MNMAKPFLSYDQQINKLTGEKGLLIPDCDYAIAILKKTSYFALICGYKDPFKNPIR